MKNLARLFIVFWVVSWTGHRYESKPCQEGEQGLSGNAVYTGAPSTAVPAVLCGEMVTKKMEKRFDTLDEANKFAEGCPVGQCSDMVVEEINE